jgi:hypothetical protein
MTLNIQHDPGQYWFTKAGTGAIGSTPVSSDITAADADILACPFSTDNTDVTTNHTFGAAGTFTANTGYNGETTFNTSAANTSIDTIAGSGTAHQLASASPVTFGGFFKLVGSPQAANPYLISSCLSGGAGNHNYSMVLIGGSLNLQSGGAGTLRDFNWNPAGAPAAADMANSSGWYHVVMQLDAGRATGRLFIDGKQFGADEAALTVGAPVGTDDLFINGINGVAAGELNAFNRNLFISSSLKTAAEIRALAEQCYGHGLPA